MNDLTIAKSRGNLAAVVAAQDTLDRESAELSSLIIRLRNSGYADRLALIERANALVESGDVARIAGAMTDAVSPATKAELKTELGMLVGAFPNAGGNDLTIFGRMLAAEVEAKRPSIGGLARACRKLRQTSRFVPTIAETLEALADAETRIHQRQSCIDEFFEVLERSEAVLARWEKENAEFRLKFEQHKREREAAENDPNALPF